MDKRKFEKTIGGRFLDNFYSGLFKSLQIKSLKQRLFALELSGYFWSAYKGYDRVIDDKDFSAQNLASANISLSRALLGLRKIGISDLEIIKMIENVEVEIIKGSEKRSILFADVVLATIPKRKSANLNLLYLWLKCFVIIRQLSDDLTDLEEDLKKGVGIHSTRIFRGYLESFTKADALNKTQNILARKIIRLCKQSDSLATKIAEKFPLFMEFSELQLNQIKFEASVYK